MEPTHKSFESFELKADAPAGTIRAVFSTFDVPDRDGDIVRASAFADGQAVPMVWAHDWSKPIGDGVIRVENNRAVFDGKFWMDTEDGEQAFRKVKNAGPLQQYSWGFRITDTQDNPQIRGYDITKAEVFEVSPVLVGANPYTQTLAVKSGTCPLCGAVKSEAQATESEATPEAQPSLIEPDWRLAAQLDVAAAELEI